MNRGNQLGERIGGEGEARRVEGTNTRVIGVVLSVGQNLQRTDEVQSIHAGMEGEENIDHFVSITALRNCTHLADRCGVCWVEALHSGIALDAVCLICSEATVFGLDQAASHETGLAPDFPPSPQLAE